MSSLVASWGHIKNKIGIGSYNSLYCPSMSQILSYSSNIAICGSNDLNFVKTYYSINQLVRLSDVSYKETSGGGSTPTPTKKTYTVTGIINLTGSGNWVLQDSNGLQLDTGTVSGPGEFEITYTGYTKPHYLEIIISFNDYNYINENRDTTLSFTSSNTCDLGTVTFESL